ncbi:MAG: hypothetical protein II238_03485, partial [Alphaproteobacteria bacterium]|nr:hypothetical protein [Alphaproteobacteria bacterium]
NAANGKSRLGCTVAAKFSRQFSDEVSWQKVDPQVDFCFYVTKKRCFIIAFFLTIILHDFVVQ